MIPRPLALGIVVLVTCVWAANFAARLFIQGYEPDITINGIFMVLVGSALLASRRKQPAEGEDDPAEELPEGVDPPPSLDQARRLAAGYLDPDRPASGSHRRRPRR